MPPVTAERSPPELADDRRGFAGDGRLVHRGHALDDVAIGGDQVARLDKDDVALFQLDSRDRRDLVMVARIGKLLGDHIRLGGPQARGLRLAAALGHRFREVREQHREPEPQDDLERKAVMAGPVTMSRRKSTVVSAATTSTTNITGFLTISRGSSLAKDAPMAGTRILGSVIVAVADRLDFETGDIQFDP